MTRLYIPDMPTLLQKVASAPPVQRAPIDRQKTILGAPGKARGRRAAARAARDSS